MRQVLARIRRQLSPPRVVAVTRRPAGWFVVSSDGVRDVIAWARYADGQVVGLVSARGGLRPATGRRVHGYLPAAPHGAGDVQLSPPAVAFPVADLDAAINDDLANPWTSDAKAAIYSRLCVAAEQEWAGRCLSSFLADPDKFLRRHLEMLVEHGRAADLDDSERDFLAGLLAGNPGARSRAEAGRKGEPS